MIGKIFFLTTTFISQTTEVIVEKPVPTTITPGMEITEDVIPQLASMLAKAVADRNYFVISGLMLMSVIYIFSKKIMPKLSDDKKYKEYIPLMTIIISGLTGLATWLLNTDLDLFKIMVTYLSIGLMAVGSWETVAKPFEKKILAKLASMKKDK